MTEPLALYIHWPFCLSKCPYCDFNSHVRHSVDTEAWRHALLMDLQHEAMLTRGRPLGSIFFGGGTPSLMPPSLVADLIDAASRHWAFASDIEITLEANPSSVEAARFRSLAHAGVNRVSLGLQALDDQALRFLGRAHDVGEGLDALETAQQNFARVSFDLIYGRPDQSESDWSRELERAISFGTGHLSVYQLTIEPGTRFATEAQRGRLVLPSPDEGAALFELTRQTLRECLPAYETSNHARSGEESRHNLTYWRYGDYAGIGPGAHGRRDSLATARHKKPENWINAVARNTHGIQTETPLCPIERATEALMMGLRLAEGVPWDRCDGLLQLIDTDRAEALAGHGLLELSDHRVRTTERGAIVLDAILAELVR